MKYTEAELAQIEKNINAVAEYLVDNYVDRLDNDNDILFVSGDDFFLTIRGNGIIDIEIAHCTICIAGEIANRTNDLYYRTKDNYIHGKTGWLLDCTHILANWKRIKAACADTWITRQTKRESVTFAFEI